MNEHYADVAPFIPLPFTKPQVFTYHLPDNTQVKKYQIVQIPWRQKTIKGVILKLHSDKVPFKTKPLIPQSTPPLTPEQVKFAYWISETMQAGLGYTLKLFPSPSVGEGDAVSSARREVKHLTIATSTQKPLYLPYKKLTSITLDQEELPGHKQWGRFPHLHSFYAATALAKIHNCPLKFTHNLPSLRYRHQTSALLSTKSLNAKIIAPSWNDKKQKYPLPSELVDKIRSWQSKKQSILLFVNQDTKPIKHFIKKVIPMAEVVRVTATKQQKSKTKNPIILSTSTIFKHLSDRKFNQLVYLYPENSLSYPDFRSEERTYYLLHRLITLNKSKITHIVTRHTRLVEDRLLLTPENFYQHQLKQRQKHHLPPTTDLVMLSISEKTAKQALKNSLANRNQLEKRIASSPLLRQGEGRPREAGRGEVYLRGPFASFTEPRKKLYTYHLLLSGPLEKITPLYQNLPIDRVDLDPNKIL